MTTTVNLIAHYASSFIQQSPEGDGWWEDVHFLANSLEATDYCVVCNGVVTPFQVNCRRRNLWLLMQEPPTDIWKDLHRGNDSYDRILTQDTDLLGNRYVLTQPATSWHVKRSYAELKQMTPCIKNMSISAMVSDKTYSNGHRNRLAFLSRLKASMVLDHYGRGFNEIDDKWSALAPYRYSLAVENYSNPYYWTEKIADCFLAWSMPIYFGCTRITEYFPAEAMICFDMDDPDAIDKIRSAIADDKWGKNLDAIEYARNLVLNRYQLLPFLTDQIKSHASASGVLSNTYRNDWIHPIEVKLKYTERFNACMRRVIDLGKRTVSS